MKESQRRQRDERGITGHFWDMGTEEHKMFLCNYGCRLGCYFHILALEGRGLKAAPYLIRG